VELSAAYKFTTKSSMLPIGFFPLFEISGVSNNSLFV
jgi:hypothetical protein